MVSINSLSSGIQTLHSAQAQLDGHAQQLAGIATEPAASRSMTEPLVGLEQAKTYALCGVKIIQADTGLLGTLLDIRA